MSDVVVYDKAKYHFDGDFPENLGREHAYVHAGIFLAWLIEREMISCELAADFSDILQQCRQREISPGATYRLLGGALVSDMLSEEGNRFASMYFDFERGQYLEDYRENLAKGLPSFYHVADSWENYDRFKPLLALRFREWCGGVTAQENGRHS